MSSAPVSSGASNALTGGLATQATTASQSVSASSTLAQSAAQSCSPPPPIPPPPPKCECCGKAQHEGQKGGNVVTEDGWYGLDERTTLDSERQQIEADMQQCYAQLKDAAKSNVDSGKLPLFKVVPRELRDRFLANENLLGRYIMRANAVKFARDRNCASLPSAPCNVYRVIPASQAKKIEDEWDAERANYQSRYGLAKGVKVNHRVPKSAGGCPIGDGNLVPDTLLSADCLHADALLTAAQSDAAARWATGGF